MKCTKVGHFAAVCHSKAAVQEITEADEDDCMFLGSVEQEKNRSGIVSRGRATMAHLSNFSTYASLIQN